MNEQLKEVMALHHIIISIQSKTLRSLCRCCDDEGMN